MNEETIVAVFDTAEHAAAAVRDLDSAGVPSSMISQHSGAASGASAVTSTTTGETTREPGFWSSLFGGEPEYGHDTTVYDRSMQGGSTVVTVQATEEHMTRILDILERHNPIDIDERAASYGLAQGVSGGQSGYAGDLKTSQQHTGIDSQVGSQTGSLTAGTEPETLRLSEETLAVGKRAINRGTTRVRRYVVETPVEESVSLRDEKVTIERRPVADGRAVTGADFSDKVIEVTETAEEAVVSKQAHVREEVVIRKDATERTETIRDTVRREDVEITKEPGVAGTTSATTTKTGGFETTAPVTSAPYKPTV